MSQSKKELYEFSCFCLDVSERLLRRDGKRVTLPDKAFDTLCALVRRAGALVGKDELMNEVWNDSIVEENNLDQKISIIRQTLGERGKSKEKFIETVRGRGYRFLPEVRRVEIEQEKTDDGIPAKTARIEPDFSPAGAAQYETKRSGNVVTVAKWQHQPDKVEESAEVKTGGAENERDAENRQATATEAETLYPFKQNRRTAALIAASLVIIAGAVFVLSRFSVDPHQASAAPIESIAVLPLRSLDAGENYLGLGIADAVIRRINQTGKMIVRPTSAVRRYLNEDIDALTAARQLNTDAVLEGSVQRADDRLRVSVNLLRTADGASLWADNFDMRMTDIFAIQDKVAQQVAARLQLKLDPSQQERLTKVYTSNPTAYEFYLKGVYAFDQRISRGKPQMETAINFFKQAIAADPNFALAHAQLAYVYAVKAVFFETTDPVWAERAREEVNRAEALDPQLAETRLARFQLLYSMYEGYQGEAAIRELLSAQQLNPNVGHPELAYLYLHFGLEDLAAREIQRASEIDPTSEYVMMLTFLLYEIGEKYDEYDAQRKLYSDPYMEAWYLMGRGRLDEAQKAIEEWSANRPDYFELPQRKALLSALKGDFRAAEAAIPSILSNHPVKGPIYHHAAYDIARIYALAGKSAEAVKWLRETAAAGFPCYPLFERDRYLNPIRQSPEFGQFLTEMKERNERHRQLFESISF